MSGQVQKRSAADELIEEIQLELAGGIVDLELDPQHYQYAIKKALGRYRQKSDNSFQESFIFLDIQPEQSVYTLPSEVQEVRSVLRRTMGGTSGGVAIDPFALAFSNNIYMINNPGGLGGGGAGMLATYDFAMQFQSTAGRLFGRDVQFSWNASSKQLVLFRKFTGQEQIALEVYNQRPLDELLQDSYAQPWLRDYSIAVCKKMIGEARGKFGQLPGPQGGITMNGDALKQEAAADMERLDKELEMFVDQHSGFPFLIG